MSMTYADADTTAVAPRTADEVFVPRYAQKRAKSKKPVKTWMIVAPIAAVAVIGTAAALVMSGGEQPAPAEATPAEMQPMQTAPGALNTGVNTGMDSAMTGAEALAPAQPAPQVAPVEATPAPVARRAEPAPRRAAAPAAAPAERPAARVETPAEPTGPRAYSASPVTQGLNTAPAVQTAPTTTPAPAPATAPAISVQPLN
jgi:hypothetical protein